MRLFFALVLGVVLTACGTGEEQAEDNLDKNFHIEGQIKGASLLKVKIEAQSERGTIPVAEVMTDIDGKYSLDGNIPGMGLYTMTVGKDQRNTIALPLDQNDHVTINGDLKTFSVAPIIKGTKWAAPLMQYMKLFNDFAQKQMELLPKETDPSKQMAIFRELRKPIDAYVQKQVEKDPGNTVNIIFTSTLLPAPETGFEGWDPSNMDLLKKMEQAYRRQHPESPITQLLSDQVAMVEDGFNQYQTMASGTMAAPEIALKDPNGKELRLSALKGKVVLVDFWASWCGPCRKENPNVVRLYKKFKSKGFEIFSVSLDQDPKAWKEAIAKDGLIWPNHVSDLMGWQSPLTQQYGFQSIPYTVLLNKDGNIIGVGLRGEQLERKLEEVLSK
jgi:thiol-disulfide isomerase/thioredoxin